VLSVHLDRSHLVLAGGLAIGVLALTARGPLGLVRVCGPRLHGVLDVGVGLALALAPVVGALRPGIAGTVAVEVGALAWLRVTTLTRFAGPARSARRHGSPPIGVGGRADQVTGAGAGERTGSPAPPGGPAPGATRALGRMVGGAQRRAPEMHDALQTGARRLGRHAGRLQRTWRRTVS
jgi:hypothetical protein